MAFAAAAFGALAGAIAYWKYFKRACRLAALAGAESFAGIALGLSASLKIFAAANPPQIKAFLSPLLSPKLHPQLIEISCSLKASLGRLHLS